MSNKLAKRSNVPVSANSTQVEPAPQSVTMVGISRGSVVFNVVMSVLSILTSVAAVMLAELPYISFALGLTALTLTIVARVRRRTTISSISLAFSVIAVSITGVITVIAACVAIITKTIREDLISLFTTDNVKQYILDLIESFKS